jgi:hypothetical protein
VRASSAGTSAAHDPAPEGAPEGEERAAWLSGVWAGAAAVAPDRVRHCAACAERFLAVHRRAVYCGARCRNRVVKRRYRARLRAEAAAFLRRGVETLAARPTRGSRPRFRHVAPSAAAPDGPASAGPSAEHGARASSGRAAA